MLVLTSWGSSEDLSSPITDGGDGKALDKLAICSRVKLGAHSRPQAEVSIVGAVESWQDECRRGLPNPRVGRNWAGREGVAEAEVALTRHHSSRDHGKCGE